MFFSEKLEFELYLVCRNFDIAIEDEMLVCSTALQFMPAAVDIALVFFANFPGRKQQGRQDSLQAIPHFICRHLPPGSIFSLLLHWHTGTHAAKHHASIVVCRNTPDGLHQVIVVAAVGTIAALLHWKRLCSSPVGDHSSCPCFTLQFLSFLT